MSVEIEVFSGPNCVHCEAAERLLAVSGLDFVELRVDDAEHLAELQRRLPRSTSLPQIFLGGEHIGSDEDLRVRESQARTPF